MKKKLIFMMIFSLSLFSQHLIEYFDIINQGDSLSIQHIAAWRNCGAVYQMEVKQIDSTIYLLENDTSHAWYYCNCYFDLITTIVNPGPGHYHLFIETANVFNGDKNLVLDTTFTIPDAGLLSHSDAECLNLSKSTTGTTEIPLIDHYESDCQVQNISSIFTTTYNANMLLTWYIDSINCDVAPTWMANLSNDTLHVTMIDTDDTDNCKCAKYLTANFGPIPAGKYILDFLDGKLGSPKFIIDENIVLDIDGSDLILNWDITDLNCCLQTKWEAWLDNDTFHVTMTDTGAPCDCICPFELSARFGPFQPGAYTLNFHNTNLGLFSFTIPGTKSEKLISVLSFHQSDCYNAVDIQNTSELPQEYALLNCYPNPFNPTTIIEYYLPQNDLISIQIYNINGHLQQTLFNGPNSTGNHYITWNAEDYSSGIYFISLQGKNFNLKRKALLLK